MFSVTENGDGNNSKYHLYLAGQRKTWNRKLINYKDYNSPL